MFIRLNLLRPRDRGLDRGKTDPIYVNLDRIETITEIVEGSVLQIINSAGAYKAIETPEEIMQLIQQKSKR